MTGNSELESQKILNYVPISSQGAKASAMRKVQRLPVYRQECPASHRDEDIVRATVKAVETGRNDQSASTLKVFECFALNIVGFENSDVALSESEWHLEALENTFVGEPDLFDLLGGDPCVNKVESFDDSPAVSPSVEIPTDVWMGFVAASGTSFQIAELPAKVLLDLLQQWLVVHPRTNTQGWRIQIEMLGPRVLASVDSNTAVATEVAPELGGPDRVEPGSDVLLADRFPYRINVSYSKSTVDTVFVKSELSSDLFWVQSLSSKFGASQDSFLGLSISH